MNKGSGCGERQAGKLANDMRSDWMFISLAFVYTYILQCPVPKKLKPRKNCDGKLPVDDPFIKPSLRSFTKMIKPFTVVLPIPVTMKLYPIASFLERKRTTKPNKVMID